MAEQPPDAPEVRQLQSELFSDLAILGEVQQRMARRLSEVDLCAERKALIATSCTLAINALNRTCYLLLRWAEERDATRISHGVAGATRH